MTCSRNMFIGDSCPCLSGVYKTMDRQVMTIYALKQDKENGSDIKNNNDLQ